MGTYPFVAEGGCGGNWGGRHFLALCLGMSPPPGEVPSLSLSRPSLSRLSLSSPSLSRLEPL